MTVCITLGAVALTPLLTKILGGTYVPVDAAKQSISTTASILSSVGRCSSNFVSVFSENIVRLKASMVAVTLPADLSLMAHA
ncbi:unnamed protein product [Prunus armeniaca]